MRRGRKSDGRSVAKRSASLASILSPESHWEKTRHGARAARGFHYQEDIGVLLAAQMLARITATIVLVPEGYEDYTCNGGRFEQVQVKSRQPEQGPFPVSDIAEFVVKVCRELLARRDAGVPGQPVLVIERDIHGIERWIPGTRIGDLPKGHPVRVAVASRARRRGVAVDVCESTEIRVISRREARAEASRIVCERYGLLPQAGEVVLRALRDEIVRCTDQNVTKNLSERAEIDRTRLETLAVEARTLIDNTELERALTTGAAEPLDLSTSLMDDRFYQGVSAEPGHVVAGLAAARPELQNAVTAASDSGRPVLITGPSGVGKSVLMWLAVREMPETLWFRVRRLSADDVPAIVALARAYNPSKDSPVGFVVDAIGVGRNQAWDHLQQQVAGIPGVRLIGTVRLEDAAQIRNLADCVTVEVGLDEALARRIYDQLEQSGVEVSMHWRTALAQAGGLTLEYTHLLTRGQRLAEVIGDQVRVRRSESRFDELKILALVATAHRWGAELELRRVQEQLGITDADLARALQRLLDEHLLTHHGSMLGGIHQLRSTALSRAVHATPPPLMTETVESILRLVDDDELGHIVASALVDYQEQEERILEIAHAELVRRASLTAWISLLHGLRVVDFRQVAAMWPARFIEAGLPPSLWFVTTQFAFAHDSPAEQLFRDDVREVSSTLRDDLGRGSRLRDAFLRLCDPLFVTHLFADADVPTSLTRALAVCDGTRIDIASWLKEVPYESSFGQVLRQAALDDLGEILHAAQAISPDLAVALLEVAGGQAAVVDRLYGEEPGLASLDIEIRSRDTVLVGQIVTIDSTEVSLDRHLYDFAKKAMLCLPHCDVTDLRSTYPDGTPVQIGEGKLEKRIRRERLVTPTDVSWNRVRLNISLLACGVPDPVRRLVEAHALVKDLRAYVDLLVDWWLDERRQHKKLAKILAQREALIARAENMRPPIPDDRRALAVLGGTPLVEGTDPVSTLVQNIADNVSGRLFRPQPDFAPLAAFLADQVRNIHRVLEEPWHLAGLEPPDAAPPFVEVLDDLRVVVAELGAGSLSQRTVAAVAGIGRGRLNRAANYFALKK